MDKKDNEMDLKYSSNSLELEHYGEDKYKITLRYRWGCFSLLFGIWNLAFGSGALFLSSFLHKDMPGDIVMLIFVLFLLLLGIFLLSFGLLILFGRLIIMLTPEECTIKKGILGIYYTRKIPTKNIIKASLKYTEVKSETGIPFAEIPLGTAVSVTILTDSRNINLERFPQQDQNWLMNFINDYLANLQSREGTPINCKACEKPFIRPSKILWKAWHEAEYCSKFCHNSIRVDYQKELATGKEAQTIDCITCKQKFRMPVNTELRKMWHEINCCSKFCYAKYQKLMEID